MNKIKYVIGDATAPVAEGLKIIVHVCNDIGAWGAGFVLALSNKWMEPEEQYRAMSEYNLGDVDYVQVEDDIIVANMIGQHGVGRDPGGYSPVRYVAIAEALKVVNDMAVYRDASIHMPRIGAGLAGGDWDLIERIICEVTTVPVTVYDFP